MKIKTYTYFIYFVYSLFLVKCNYTQPTLDWERRYPPSDTTFIVSCHSQVLDDSGSIYITGGIDSIHQFSGYCTVKYNSNGTMQWASKFYSNGVGGRSANSIAVDKLGNCYVTGYSLEPARYFDYCTIKYNSAGVEEWVKYYDWAVSYDEAQKVVVDNVGNIIVSGFVQSGIGDHIATIKYSTGGDEIWIRIEGISALYSINQLITDENSNIYLTGIGNDSAMTIKYDSSGNLSWKRTFAGSSPTPAISNSIILDKYNNVFITGLCFNVGPYIRHGDFFTIKYSSSGIQQWVRTYNTDTSGIGSIYEAKSIVVDKSGGENIYVSGYFYPDQFSPRKACTIKYSNNGDLIWVRKDTARLMDQLIAMDIDLNNNLYVNVHAIEYINKIIKYDSSGLILWNLTDLDSLDFSSSMKIDNDFNIYLSGDSYNGNKNFAFVQKYSQPIGIRRFQSSIQKRFKLSQNYPNPFNPTTKIKFDIPNLPLMKGAGGMDVRLTIYDLLGREIATLVNEQLKPGSYEAEWDGSNYASGIYFYTLKTDNFSRTRKMILLK